MTLLLAPALAVPGDVRTIPPGTPADVRFLVERRMSCNHWRGEERYDRERAAEIARAWKGLRCEAVDRDERRLRARHARRPAVVRLLIRSRDWVE